MWVVWCGKKQTTKACRDTILIYNGKHKQHNKFPQHYSAFELSFNPLSLVSTRYETLWNTGPDVCEILNLILILHLNYQIWAMPHCCAIYKWAKLFQTVWSIQVLEATDFCQLIFDNFTILSPEGSPKVFESYLHVKRYTPCLHSYTGNCRNKAKQPNQTLIRRKRERENKNKEHRGLKPTSLD